MGEVEVKILDIEHVDDRTRALDIINNMWVYRNVERKRKISDEVKYKLNNVCLAGRKQQTIIPATKNLEPVEETGSARSGNDDE
ncbi:hypothetical protein Y032_0265g639 [Ancylostoma ceylanicum]|uniref:Uncharacterized protein n=1 Tax=Ancylostoma ceylanicum TaxID=53326 RepID=A0A016SAH2_9BILA|nr:hypothetical protein Y032_0265g639 [Ancylostoma ceylanicum]